MATKKVSSLPVHTFIVRVWRKAGPQGVRWHGQVQHVQSGERGAFADEKGLLIFIRRWVKISAGSSQE